MTNRATIAISNVTQWSASIAIDLRKVCFGVLSKGHTPYLCLYAPLTQTKLYNHKFKYYGSI